MSAFQVDEDGELVRDRRGFVRIQGIDAIGQDCRTYVKLRQGEIPTRQDKGLPWQPMLSAGVSSGVLAQIVGERGILSRPGVVAQETTVEIDGQTRVGTVRYRAQVSLDDQRRRSALVGSVTIPI